jgi:hypothetical protein
VIWSTTLRIINRLKAVLRDLARFPPPGLLSKSSRKTSQKRSECNKCLMLEPKMACRSDRLPWVTARRTLRARTAVYSSKGKRKEYWSKNKLDQYIYDRIFNYFMLYYSPFYQSNQPIQFVLIHFLANKLKYIQL